MSLVVLLDAYERVVTEDGGSVSKLQVELVCNCSDEVVYCLVDFFGRGVGRGGATKSVKLVELECRLLLMASPMCPGNIYGKRQHPIEQLWDIENTSRWQQTVGEASQPPQPDSPDNIPGGFPDTSAMPSEDDVQKMCEEGGANLVRYLMGKALAVSDNQYKNVPNWSYKDIARLPQAEQKHWRLACQEELDML